MSAPTIPSLPSPAPALPMPAPPAPALTQVVIFELPVEVPLPPQDLPEEDGENLETGWHRDAINLLVELIRSLFLGRTDFFAGGNMFIHFSSEHVRNRDFRGPDVFFVKDVDGSYDRPYWAIWHENGRYPNLIIELLSPSTALIDRTTKKDVYERSFRTPEYVLYDPETQTLEGWRLDEHQRYQPIQPDEHGRLWSEQLGVWIGTWTGHFQGWLENVWLRFFTESGDLVPLFAEREKERANEAETHADKEKNRADEAKMHADEEKNRADKAEAELTRMKALFAEKGLTLPDEK